MEASELSNASLTPVVVRSGFTRGDRDVLVGVILLVPIGVAMWLFLPGPGGPVLPLRVSSVLVVLGVVGLLGFIIDEFSQPRSIELSPDGVRFQYIIHHETRPWGDLEPRGKPYRRGEWWIIRRTPALGSRRGYSLTLAQARALLMYPACPRWPLPPEVVRSLELTDLKSGLIMGTRQ